MNDTEISAQEAAPPPKSSFSKRLREALETLAVGKCITLRTKEDRQTVTNAVIAVKKKTGFVLTTHQLQARDDTGRMVIQITRGVAQETATE